MNALYSVLSFVAMHGYWFVLAALVAVLCVRDRPKRVSVLRALLIVGGIIVGSIFLGAAMGKMKPAPGFEWSWASVRISIAYFTMQVASYEILSPTASILVARVLPFFELALGLWLVSGIARRFSSLLASIVFVCFMSAITYAYFRGLKIDCGCGIGPAEEVGPGALLRDGLRFLLPSVLLTIGAFYVRRNRLNAPVADAIPSAAHAD
jgi:hypothetical protein